MNVQEVLSQMELRALNQEYFAQIATSSLTAKRFVTAHDLGVH